MKKTNFFTHGGFFHADEVTAYAACILAGAVPNDHSGLVRLTDLSGPCPENGIVADIYHVYDPMQLRFDHHQGFFPRNGNGIPYASAGLVWATYGFEAANQVVSADEAGRMKPSISEIEAIAARVDLTLIQGIDAHDADNAYTVTATCSGGEVRVVTISHLIAGMNTADIRDAAAQDAAFKLAANFIVGILRSHILAAAKFVEARKRFSEIAQVDGQVIILRENMPWRDWREIVAEIAPKAIYVIHPSGHPGNPWSMTAVTTTPESRECIKPIERPFWFQDFIHQGKWIAGGQSIEELRRLAIYNGAKVIK